MSARVKSHVEVCFEVYVESQKSSPKTASTRELGFREV